MAIGRVDVLRRRVPGAKATGPYLKGAGLLLRGCLKEVLLDRTQRLRGPVEKAALKSGPASRRSEDQTTDGSGSLGCRVAFPVCFLLHHPRPNGLSSIKEGPHKGWPGRPRDLRRGGIPVLKCPKTRGNRVSTIAHCPFSRAEEAGSRHQKAFSRPKGTLRRPNLDLGADFRGPF